MIYIRKSEDGLVSLVSAIIVSLLLLIVIIAMVYVMISVQRQATDADLSNRAYFAAESGAEEKVLEIEGLIKNATSFDNAFGLLSGVLTNLCGPVVPLGPVGNNSGASIVCRTVKAETQEIIESAAREESNEYIIKGVEDLRTIKIDWNLNLTDSARPTNFGGYGSAATWDAPAVIEILDVAYDPNNITNPYPSTKLLRPGGLPAPAPTSAHVAGSLDASPSNEVINGTCAPAPGDYDCHATVTYSPNLDRIFRIRPRFAGTHYRLRFYNSGGTLMTVRDSKVTVDVTAQAGDVLRRVVVKTKIRAAVLPGLDYALFSDTDICKIFEVNLIAKMAEAPGPQTLCP